jgi:serine-type D-Ala-D-Ala carboxypeptidase/endopeptidase (penicillin-binding protein 4)
MRITISIGCLLAVASALVAAHAKEPPQKSNERMLKADIEALLMQEEFASASIGVHVVSASTKQVLFEHNAQRLLLPASTQKIFTTATALEKLGPNFRFTTTVMLDGTIQSNGEFAGVVLVRGSGDPTSSATFASPIEGVADRIAEVFDSLGIQSIRGTIIGDDDVFDDQPYADGWGWEDLSYGYAPQVGGLNIADNAVRIFITPPATLADIPLVKIVPSTDYVHCMPLLRIVDSTGITQITVARNKHSNVIDLQGSIRYSASRDTIKVTASVENPTMYWLSLFRDGLQRRGIRHRGALLDIDDWNENVQDHRFRTVVTLQSIPLSEIIAVINHKSDNLGSEVLLKTLGSTPQQEGGFRKGADIVKQFVRHTGVLVDGSGLSRLNLSSAEQLTKTLVAMHLSEHALVFRASLAAPGEPGTLEHRMIGTKAQESVRAKTGSMNNVCSLAGYVESRDNEPLAFAIIINGYNGPLTKAQALQDVLCMRLASFTRKN